jgi:hypothetical protein
MEDYKKYKNKILEREKYRHKEKKIERERERERQRDREKERQIEKIIIIKRKLLNLIYFIQDNYKNKYIHFSNKELSIDILENKINNENSYHTSNVYMNPYGIWISCGSNWIEWILKNKLYKSKWANVKYVYEIKINKNNIIKIKNIDELIKFHNKYAKYNNENGFKINWTLVKKDYDGIIICPYLGEKIWKNIDDRFFYINDEINKYIRKTLKKNLIKYPEFYLEWYRHWETSTGVIWKMSSIKNINLIKSYI